MKIKLNDYKPQFELTMKTLLNREIPNTYYYIIYTIQGILRYEIT